MTGPGELDLHLIGEGRHEQLWDVLGAHVQKGGTSFAVWAPNARSVSVVGDFNGWDGNANPMQPAPSGGIWTTVVEGVGDGAYYQYLVHGADGIWRQKADPLAFAAEPPPATGSRVFTSTHVWQDDAWLAERSRASSCQTWVEVNTREPVAGGGSAAKASGSAFCRQMPSAPWTRYW